MRAMVLLAFLATVIVTVHGFAHPRNLAPRVGDFVPKPVDLSKYVGKTVLMIGAHPDDLETCVGGTVALLREQGTQVVYVLTTTGDKGWSKDYTMTSEKLAAIRYDEQMAAAQVLNVSKVVMLDYEDGFLNNAAEADVRQRIVAAIRTYTPVAVFTWSPYLDFAQYQNGLEHPDHRTTGQITLDAVYPSARDYLVYPMLFQAGLAGWKVQDVYLFTFDNMQYYTNITNVVQPKISALLEHRSQYTNATAVAESVRSMGANIARQVGKSGYAEGFTWIPQLP